MDNGRITAAGKLNDLLTRFDLPIAHDSDAAAIIEASAQDYDETFDLSTLQFAGGTLQAVGRIEPGPVRVRVLARDVSVTLERQTDTSILNILPVSVVAVDARIGSTTSRAPCSDASPASSPRCHRR